MADLSVRSVFRDGVVERIGLCEFKVVLKVFSGGLEEGFVSFLNGGKGSPSLDRLGVFCGHMCFVFFQFPLSSLLMSSLSLLMSFVVAVWFVSGEDENETNSLLSL